MRFGYENLKKIKKKKKNSQSETKNFESRFSLESYYFAIF